MDSAEIKRMILAESESTGIRKRMVDNREKEGGLNTDDILDMGNAFDMMVKSKGWAFIEAYIINRANPVRMLMRNDVTESEKGSASALMGLMQYVKQVIDAKTAILEKVNAERSKEGNGTPA
jgi:hypothetical protein